jgi:hypothetical protein
MKKLAALAFLALSLPISAFGQTARKTSAFTSPDGAFRFVYPSNFQSCTKGKTDQCRISVIIPVCGTDALVCVLYPSEAFKGTSTSGVGFQVREILDNGYPPTTADACVTPQGGTYSENFLISAEHPVEVIDGVSFIHGINGSAAGGSSSGTELYRAFQQSRCFELSISSSGANPNSSDAPMRTLTPAQQRKIDQTMSDILHSFRFSN